MLAKIDIGDVVTATGLIVVAVWMLQQALAGWRKREYTRSYAENSVIVAFALLGWALGTLGAGLVHAGWRVGIVAACAGALPGLLVGALVKHRIVR